MRGFKGLLVVGAVLGLAALLIPGSGMADGRVRRCLGEPATKVGTRGADRIRGTPGEDVIVALGGADRISGLGGQEDSICGGKGSDTIYVSTKAGFDTCAGGDSHVSGGRGNDRIFGGGESFSAQGDKGDDLINGCSLGGIRIVTYFYSDTPVFVKLWNNFATGEGRDILKNIKWVFGSQFDDTLVGSSSAETERLGGGAGKDSIDGVGGPDHMFGGLGDDGIYGRDGVAGNDIVHGEDGDDYCTYDDSDEVQSCETSEARG